jgi:hypothetical protein
MKRHIEYFPVASIPRKGEPEATKASDIIKQARAAFALELRGNK